MTPLLAAALVGFALGGAAGFMIAVYWLGSRR
jgi:hypothetical protein